MLLTNIFENIENCNMSDFRYLMYLSQNNDAFVMVGKDIYKIKIISVVNFNSSNPNELPLATMLDAKNERELKLEISQFARGNLEFVNSSESTNKGVQVSGDAVGYKFHNLVIHLKNRSICINLMVMNFEMSKLSEFLQSGDDNINEADKNSAYQSAKKNAIWMAVASGDDAKLAILMQTMPMQILYETHKGKNILTAMLNAVNGVDLPFNESTDMQKIEPDYEATLRVLFSTEWDITKTASGEEKTYIELCREYYKKHNSSYLKMFSASSTQDKIFNYINLTFNDILKEPSESYLTTLYKRIGLP